jgi:hypothetical protein
LGLSQHEIGAIRSELNSRNSDAFDGGKKDSKKTYRNSLLEIPENIEALLASVRPANKRQNERDCALQLLTEYSAADLVAAVKHLEQHGVLGSGNPVHSPFKYLTSAAEQVFAQINRQEKGHLKIAIPQQQVEISQSSSTEALPVFERQLSDEAKEKYIAQYVESELSHGFIPPQGILRKLAALKWFNEQRGGAGHLSQASA